MRLFEHKLKTASVMLLFVAGLAHGAEQFIEEIHPTTYYPVILEFQYEVNDINVYEPIPSTPESSKNICQVKPSACYKPVARDDESPGNKSVE